MPAGTDVREREIGHYGTRRTEFVGVVEMINIGRVEVYGLFDPAQAKLVGEEIVVLARIRRH